jgi:hypothetical protein
LDQGIGLGIRLLFVGLVVGRFHRRGVADGIGGDNITADSLVSRRANSEMGGTARNFCGKMKIFFGSRVIGHWSLVEDAASHWLSAGGRMWKLEGG